MEIIKLQNVSKSFGTHEILKKINLTINISDRIVILGSSGVGKSVLLSLISLLDSPSSGEIYFDGTLVTKKNTDSFRESLLSFVFQKPIFFEDKTVLANLLIPTYYRGLTNEEGKREIVSYLSRFKILPLMNMKISLLSGGERQRVEVIQTLLTKKPILIMDEPTGGLDSKNGQLLIKELISESQFLTSIMVTHDKLVAELFGTRIFKLEKDGLHELKKCEVKSGSLSLIKKNKIGKKLSFVHAFNKLKVHLKSISLSLILTSVFLALIGLLISPMVNLKQIKESLVGSYFEGLTISYYKETKEKIDSHLTMVKKSLPDEREINSFKNSENIVTSGYSLEHFVPGFLPRTEEHEMFYFSPILSFPKELMTGTIPTTIYEVVANNVGSSKALKIGDKLPLNIAKKISFVDHDFKMNEELNLQTELVVVGLVSENTLFNMPTIYYSYEAYKDYFQKKEFSRLYEEYVGPRNFYDLLNHNDSFLPTTYFFGFQELELDKLEDKVLQMQPFDSNVSLKMSSHSLELTEMMITLFKEIVKVLYFLLALLAILSLALLALTLYVFYQKQEKELIRELTLGQTRKGMHKLTYLEFISISSVVTLLSMVIMSISGTVVDAILKANFYVNSVFSLPMTTLSIISVIIFLTMASLGLLFSHLMLKNDAAIPLQAALKEEI